MSTAAEMERLMEQAYQLRSALNPRDISDAQYLMSKTTWEQLRNHLLTLAHGPDAPPSWPDVVGDRLFTIPVREDSRVPDGEIRLVAENSTDRALRRAAASGGTVNMARMAFPPPSPPPVPTLRALLRHWRGRVPEVLGSIINPPSASVTIDQLRHWWRQVRHGG